MGHLATRSLLDGRAATNRAGPARFLTGVLPLLGLALFVPNGPAFAAAAGSGNAERIAIARLHFAGQVPEALRATLADRLVSGLTAVNFQVVRAPLSREPGNSVEIEGGRACTDADCFRALAQKLRVGHLVTALVEENDKTFAVTLELISGRNGAVVGTNRERCEICGVEEVGEKMSLAAATLRSRLEALTRSPALFVIRTRPPGATVAIDGRRVGRTPLDLTLESGPHTMVLEREGYDPLERSFVATSGVDESLDLDLVRLPTRFPFRAAGWTAVASSVALAAGGIYFLGLDGQEVSCSPGEKDLRGNCPRVYRTNVVGASLLGLSAVSATLGGVWLYLARPGSGGLLGGERQATTIGIRAAARF